MDNFFASETIAVTDSTVFGFTVTGIMYLTLPAAAFFLARRYGAASVYPVIVGAIVYHLSTMLCDLCTYVVGAGTSFAGMTVIAAELVCIFEETGRFLAMKYPIANISSTHRALCYGIGHAGLECWIRGVQQFKVVKNLNELKIRGLDSLVSGLSEERAAAVTEELRRYAENGIFMSMLDQIICIINFGFHTALSLLLFKKLGSSDRQKRWLLAAILLHYCMNFTVWLASLTGNMLFQKLTGIICGIAVITAVSKMIDLKQCMDEIKYPVSD